MVCFGLPVSHFMRDSFSSMVMSVSPTRKAAAKWPGYTAGRGGLSFAPNAQ